MRRTTTRKVARHLATRRQASHGTARSNTQEPASPPRSPPSLNLTRPRSTSLDLARPRSTSLDLAHHPGRPPLPKRRYPYVFHPFVPQHLGLPPSQSRAPLRLARASQEVHRLLEAAQAAQRLETAVDAPAEEVTASPESMPDASGGVSWPEMHSLAHPWPQQLLAGVQGQYRQSTTHSADGNAADDANYSLSVGEVQLAVMLMALEASCAGCPADTSPTGLPRLRGEPLDQLARRVAAWLGSYTGLLSWTAEAMPYLGNTGATVARALRAAVAAAYDAISRPTLETRAARLVVCATRGAPAAAANSLAFRFARALALALHCTRVASRGPPMFGTPAAEGTSPAARLANVLADALADALSAGPDVGCVSVDELRPWSKRGAPRDTALLTEALDCELCELPTAAGAHVSMSHRHGREWVRTDA